MARVAIRSAAQANYQETPIMNTWLRRCLGRVSSSSIRKRPRIRLTVESLEERCTPAVINVTTLTDENTPNDGHVSLREAINAINAGNDLGDPDINAELPGTFGSGDEIVFSVGLTGGIAVTGPLPFLNRDMSIQGPGADQLQIFSQFSNGHILEVNAGTVSLSGLKITGGFEGARSGGGLIVDGSATVSLTQCIFDRNLSGRSGGAIDNSGNLTVTRCTISSNQAFNGDAGAGIFNEASGILTVVDSTFTGNSTVLSTGKLVGSGGAIGNAGTLQVSGSTFAGNSSEFGGAIRDDGFTSQIVNSTFIQNNAANSGGAIFNGHATMTLVNDTITGNTANSDNQGAAVDENRGGGIATVTGQATTLIKNTIVAGNSTFANNVKVDDDVDHALDGTSSFNLIGVDANGGLGITNGAQGNQVGSSGSRLDPKLGALASNGGNTQTCVLLAGSPALDAGTTSSGLPTPPSTDQRGLPRGSKPDLGAVEMQVAILNPLPGDITMTAGQQQFVNILVSDVPGSRLLTATVTSDNQALFPNSGLGVNPITSSLTLNPVGSAGGTANLTASISGNGDTQSVTFKVIVNKLTQTITVSTLDDGNTDPQLISLRQAIATANGDSNDTIIIPAGLPGATGAANAYTLASGQISIQATMSIQGPGASSLAIVGNGTRLFEVSTGTVTLSGLTFRQGTTTGGAAGAALLVDGGATLTVDRDVFDHNDADHAHGGHGGGIDNSGTLTVTSSTFSNNQAQRGGAVSNHATATIINSTFAGNLANEAGGGIFNDGTITLVNDTITSNTANADNIGGGLEKGGGIESTGGTVTLLDTIVAGNFTNNNTAPDDVDGALAGTSSFNLIGVDANGNLGISNGTQNNLVGSTGSPIDARLGVLGNNGGPTPTVPLLAGSPVVGAGSASGNPTPPTIDQRGQTRASTPDIGAFETQVALLAPLPGPVTMNAGKQKTVTINAGSVPAGITPTATSDDHALFPDSGLGIDSNGSLTLNPTGSGSANITVTITDPASHDTESTSFAVTVFALPLAVADTASTPAGTAVSIDVLGNDSDPNANPPGPLTINSVANGANGTTSSANGKVTYTPNAGFTGPDTFKYIVQSSEGGTAEGTVNVTVTQLPVANTDNGTTTVGAPVTIDVLANDTDPNPNAGPLTIQSVANGTSGTTALVNGKVVYTPNAGFTGSDSFTYVALASEGGTATGAVHVTVSSLPTAADDSASTPSGSPVTIDVLANDSGPGTLSVQSADNGTNGTTAIVNNKVVYTPGAGFTGSDSFHYTMQAGSGTASATVTVTVTKLPLATADTASTPKGSPVTIDVLGNDSDPNANPGPLTLQSVASGTNGTAAIVNGKVVYTPNTGFTGSDHFTYVVAASAGGTATGNVDVTVTQLPVAVNDIASTAPGVPVPVIVDVLANDSDPGGGTLSLQTVGTAGHGTTALVNGQVKYTPAPGFIGSDHFTYTVQASEGTSATAGVNVTVTALAPTASNTTATTSAGTAVFVNVLAGAADPNGGTVALQSVSNPRNGTATVSGNQVIYTPQPGFAGSDSFTYTVASSENTTASGIVFVTVNPVDPGLTLQAPTAGNIFRNGSLPFDGNLKIAANPAAGNPSLAVVLSVTDGSLSLEAPGVTVAGNATARLSLTGTLSSINAALTSLVYMAPRHQAGSFQLKVIASATDPTLTGASATVTVPIVVTARAPQNRVRGNRVFKIAHNQVLKVSAAKGLLSGITSPDGEPLQAILVTGPRSGKLTLKPSGAFTYRPAPGFHGTVTFVYKASDGAASTSRITVVL